MTIANENGRRIDLVMDFVNTRDLETGVDAISTTEELGTWLSDNELVDDVVEPSERELTETVRVREAVRELLLAHNDKGIDTDDACNTLETAARTARLVLRFHEGRTVLEPEGDGASAALGRLVAAVADLMTTDEWQRLKACRDETCRQAFYDQSRNRSRAWCSMEVCGNREKARSFRERHAH
ncbi:MAG: CGNR zinc finger domain-containing protein [Gaiellaceae bacterium]